jgi:hypothetical protein
MSVMMTVRHPGGEPSLADVARLLRVDVHHLDPEFGVQLIDDDQYTVLVDEHVASQPNPKDVEGPFSNPRIAPFGPIESQGESAVVPPARRSVQRKR